MSYKHCIINFADEKGNYLKGQKRLAESLSKQGYQGNVHLFQSHTQIPGCRPHHEVKYGFKTHAIKMMRDMGYDVVLYVDASIWAVRNVMPCLQHIYEKGHLFEKTGHSLGQWCNDYTLGVLGITRQQALDDQYHMFSAGFTGLNFKNEKASEFFDKWHAYSVEASTFNGDHKDHRHDQCSGAFLAKTLGLEVTDPHFMQYYYANSQIKENSIFLAQGV